MVRKRSFSFLLLSWMLVSFNWIPRPAVEASFSVMSYNVLFSAFDLSETLAVLKTADADIIALQECNQYLLNVAAKQLGYFSHSFSKNCCNLTNNDTGILSRFPIKKIQPDLLQLDINGRSVQVVNVHLSPFNYTPDLLRDGQLHSPEHALKAAQEDLRMQQIQEGLAACHPGLPTLILGDLNEPSHLDWTAEAAAQGLHFGMVIPFPISSLLAAEGFKDAYRELYPDPLQYPGYTWTSMDKPGEIPERIDRIYYRGEPLQLLNMQIIGEKAPFADIIVQPYPSDHRAVLGQFHLSSQVGS